MKKHFPKLSAFVITFISLVFLAGVSGCEKEKPPPPPPKKPANTTAVKKVAPKPDAPPPAQEQEAEEKKQLEVIPAATPVYDPEGKRDPFVSFMKGDVELQDEQEPQLPLQRYELGELKFVGVIWAGKDAKALLEDARGEGFSVGVGDKIGRSGGVITKITDSEIIVREQFSGVGGKMVARESTLQLISAGGK